MSNERWNKPETRYQSAKDHYDRSYCVDQTKHGEWRGRANAWKFTPYLSGRNAILDFGCGDGSLLQAVGGQFGVEINPHSADMARAKGLHVKESLEEYEDSMFDLVISNHCLEHVEEPLQQIKGMRRVLRPDGLLVIVVPCHRPDFSYKESDRDYHLYSWSAANIGNLVKLAGFDILDARHLPHRWPPKWPLILRYGGMNAFHFASRIWARIATSSSQVRCVARPRP